MRSNRSSLVVREIWIIVPMTGKQIRAANPISAQEARRDNASCLRVRIGRRRLVLFTVTDTSDEPPSSLTQNVRPIHATTVL